MELAHATIGQLDVWSSFIFDKVSRGCRRARGRARGRRLGLALVLGLLLVDAATDDEV